MALRSSFQNVFVFSDEFVPLLLKKTKSLAIVQCEYELMFVVTCIHGGGGGCQCWSPSARKRRTGVLCGGFVRTDLRGQGAIL